nr:hypothetical protein [Tanacetum cinerariifolium]
STSNPPADPMETLTVETPIPTASSPIPTAYSNDSQEISKRVVNQEETPSLDNILSLTNQFEDILGVTTNSDKTNGVEADISNMQTTITSTPTPTLRIHKDHPKIKIIGPLDTPIQTSNKSKEVEAMQEELLQFKIQNVWTLVDCLKGEEGIDYDEVFTPVARIEAIILFLAYVSFMGFTVYQMDVKSAFLYGSIDEEVYVIQPPGFQDPEFPAKVYKVEKSMGIIDQTLFIRRQRGDFILVQVYVDDIIFRSSNPQLCREFEALMHEKFQMSAMGDMLKEFGYSDVKSSNSPMDKENPWGKDGTGKDIDLHLYRSMIGSLMHLTASRPDIMFNVCAYARHQVTPKECHLHTVKRIFRYLKSHPKLGLWYPKESPFNLVAYVDSDYGGATQDHKSTTGGCQFLGRRLISWQCKKQTIIATSTNKAEYVAAASCCRQVMWIQNQLLDYGLSLPCEALSREFSTSILRFNTIMARLQFCDYHNMVAILEKSEHNIDFHPMVDFIEASPLRIETTEEGTQIIATVDGIYRTVTESSLRRNLKLKDEEGITIVRQYTRRTSIAQSSVPPTVADEPASPLRDVSQGEDCPTDSDFIADQYRATIDKSSTLPHDSAPMVISPAAVEGNDAPIKGRSMDEREAATKRISDDSEEMATVLTSMDAATVLASRVVDVPTGSGSIPTASTPAEEQVPTGSDVVPTASLGFATSNCGHSLQKKKSQGSHGGEYHQFASELPMERRIGLISDLVKYQDNYAKESVKKHKISEEVPEEVKSHDEVPEEKVKEMMQLVPIEEVMEGLRFMWSASCNIQGQRNFHAIREGLPSKEGSSTCDDQLQASSGELLSDGK